MLCNSRTRREHEWLVIGGTPKQGASEALPCPEISKGEKPQETANNDSAGTSFSLKYNVKYEFVYLQRNVI